MNTSYRRFVITGGAGFIGNHVVRELLVHPESEIPNLDRLSFPGARATLSQFDGHLRYRHIWLDRCDTATLTDAIAEFKSDAIMHLAAESHIDRSTARLLLYAPIFSGRFHSEWCAQVMGSYDGECIGLGA